MKIELRCGEYTEEIRCADQVFLVGLCMKDIHGGITIIDGLEEYFEDVTCQEIKRHLPGDMTIRLLCYASDAVSVAKHFKGMNMLEFCCGDLTVTASM